jgi:nucleotide-binding universal stress UspA family protein
MSYASVMVYVGANRSGEQLVGVAAGLASKFSATLIGLSALAIRAPFVTTADIVVPEVTAVEVEAMRAELDRRGEWFRKVAAAAHGTAEWRAELDYPVDTLTREARSADLIVIGRNRGQGDAYDSLDPGEAVLKMGRPTLVVPDDVGSLRGDHVVIGWKDTPEARRAVRDALPLLHEASRVTIIEICEPGDENHARKRIDDVARYLALHRISGGPRVILHQEGSGAAALIRLAQHEGADLLVTGAYGHSRLGEWIFGGVTRDLLATCPICCLMAH